MRQSASGYEVLAPWLAVPLVWKPERNERTSSVAYTPARRLIASGPPASLAVSIPQLAKETRSVERYAAAATDEVFV
jgi:hypothetical protein